MDARSRLVPVRSWLYAPGNNPKLLQRVFGAGADAVILDLEDAVPPSEKEHARDLVAQTVRERSGQAGPRLFVRINHPSSGLAEADIKAVVHPGLDGVRVPKVEDAATVERVDGWLRETEPPAGLGVGSVPLVCNIESALGVRNAEQIAAASPRVRCLGFGAVDFVQDIGATPEPEGLATLYARSALVIASRVAGVQPPVDSVYTRLDDLEGLERSTHQSRGLGFFGRSCLHPRQVPVVNAAFTPTPAELDWARALLAAAQAAEQTGRGTLQLDTGEFVDVAVVRRAERLVQLADQLATLI
jgi:citrate lyase subunit beta / citryl-CoA lyase